MKFHATALTAVLLVSGNLLAAPPSGAVPQTKAPTARAAHPARHSAQLQRDRAERLALEHADASTLARLKALDAISDSCESAIQASVEAFALQTQADAAYAALELQNSYTDAALEAVQLTFAETLEGAFTSNLELLNQAVELDYPSAISWQAWPLLVASESEGEVPSVQIEPSEALAQLLVMQSAAILLEFSAWDHTDSCLQSLQ